jgi:hypothetical protein
MHLFDLEVEVILYFELMKGIEVGSIIVGGFGTSVVTGSIELRRRGRR